MTITAPANGATFSQGAPIVINATGAGGVASVNFKMDGTSIGTDNTVPFSATNSTVLSVGSHTITAVGDGTINATPVTINVAANALPSCTLTNPINGSNYFVGVTVTNISARTDGPWNNPSVTCSSRSTTLPAVAV